MKKFICFIGLICVLCGGMVFAQGSAKDSEKSIVIYFSRADENYGVGTVVKGNTQVLAEIIAEQTNSDMFKIEPVKAYAKDYDTCIQEAKDEQKKNARPAIKATLTQAELDKYDTIYFGSPVWWGDLPMAAYTFIEGLNWKGKNIRFFGTHEGSGISGIERGFKSAAKGCVIQGKSLSMYGRDAQKNDEAEKTAVKNWLGK